jgi:predicted transcriptional regulator
MKGFMMLPIANSPREIRRNLDMNQKDFWLKVGVTQSGGSRYENGRNMPRPVSELLRIFYIDQIDLRNIQRMDIEVLNYLKREDAALFKSLKKAVREKSKTVSMQAT